MIWDILRSSGAEALVHLGREVVADRTFFATRMSNGNEKMAMHGSIYGCEV
jgi:hypothetical protein